MRFELPSVECWEISYITTRILSESTDAHQAAARLLHLLGSRLQAEYGGFWVLSGNEPGIRCAAVWPDSATEDSFRKVTKQRIFNLGEGLPGRAWESRSVVWEENVSTAPNFPRSSVARVVGFKTGFAFPAYSGRSVLAVIELIGKEEHPSNDQLIEFFEALGGQIGLFLQRFELAETLSDAAAEFRLIADASQHAVITIDEQSTVLFTNAAIFDLLGYRPEELIGKSLTAIIPDRMKLQHEQGMARYIRTGQRNLDWDQIHLPALHKQGAEVSLTLAFGQFWRNGKRVFTGFAKRAHAR